MALRYSEAQNAAIARFAGSYHPHGALGRDIERARKQAGPVMVTTGVSYSALMQRLHKENP